MAGIMGYMFYEGPIALHSTDALEEQRAEVDMGKTFPVFPVHSVLAEQLKLNGCMLVRALYTDRSLSGQLKLM